MSLLKPSSLSLPAVRSSWTCRNCLRPFSSSSSSNQEGGAPTRSTFTALLDNLKRSPSNAAPRDQSSNRLRTSDAPRPNVFEAVGKSIQETGAANRRIETAADIERAAYRQDLEKQLTRRWRSGDVYSPHDLSGVEMSKWKQIQPKGKPKRDILDMLKINPMDHYKNFALMSDFVTEMGRIKHSRETGLRPVNQRRMAKAVRRAIGLGLMSSVHRHPEILTMEMEGRRN